MSLYDAAWAIHAEAQAFEQARDAAPISIFEAAGASGTPGAPPPKAAFAPALQRLWQTVQRLGGIPLLQAKSRRLRVSETVSLGEKRFVSIVEVDGVSLLIGGGSGHVALLTPLGDKPATPSFQGALESAWRGKELA